MGDMADVGVTLLTAPAILALVNLLKGLGLSGRLAALNAVIIGVALAVGEHYAPAEVWETIATGLILGLSAAGLYDLKAEEPEDETVLSAMRTGGRRQRRLDALKEAEDESGVYS